MRFVALGALLASVVAVPASAGVRDYRVANEHKILGEFVDLLAIPNVAADTPNIRRNAQALIAMMEKRGLSPRLLEGADATTPPIVCSNASASSLMARLRPASAATAAR